MSLRDELVTVALKWQKAFGVAPHITSVIAEYDAAKLVGILGDDYGLVTAVSKGSAFDYNKKPYQIKANRSSGRKGSFVTLVPKTNNYNWNILI